MSVFKYKPLISVYFNEIETRLKYKINEYDYKQLINFAESDYQRFVDFYKIEILNVDFENKRSNISRGRMKKYNQFYGRGRPYENEYFEVEACNINFELDVLSGEKLFSYAPITNIINLSPMKDIDFRLNSKTNSVSTLSFSTQIEMNLVNGKTPDEMKKIFENEYNECVRDLKNKISIMNQNVEDFNNSLIKVVKGYVKDKIEKDSNLDIFATAIGIGIESKNKDKAGNTKINILPKKVSMDLPEKKTIDEYYIEEKNYNMILNTIKRHLECTEELPGPIIKLKDEELIRDTILWTLKENFIIANGEVFRVNGKTDIHVDFNGKTAFIAECKVWHGAKLFSDAINQIYSYTTWRDCRISIIIFNLENKDFGALCNSLNETIKQHKSYISTTRYNGKNEWTCVFKNEYDSTKNLIIDVIVANYYSLKEKE